MASQELVKVNAAELQEGLAVLQRVAEHIVVNDANSCLAAKTVQRDVRNYLKDVEYKLKPFVAAAKASYDKARDELKRWTDPAERIDEALALKVKTYEREEREAAQREQDRINAENAKKAREKAEADEKARKEKIEADRKVAVAEIKRALKAREIGNRESAKLLKIAGADAEAAAQKAEADAEEAKNAPVPEVRVKPNIPTVAGVPSTVTWHGGIVDTNKLLDAFAAATGGRREYLRQFIQANDSAINREAKVVKDSKKLEHLIPGCKGWAD